MYNLLVVVEINKINFSFKMGRTLMDSRVVIYRGFSSLQQRYYNDVVRYKSETGSLGTVAQNRLRSVCKVLS